MSEAAPVPAASAGFAGFGPDAMGFLDGLAVDNSKAYFDAHRPVYDEQILPPLKVLVTDVGSRLVESTTPNLDYESKVGRSLFRINRDLRFGNDPTPYHSHLDIIWWQGSHPRTSPSFICRIRPDEVRVGAGALGLDKERLDLYRNSIVGPAGDRLEEIVDDLRRDIADLQITEPSRTRVPKGFDADHRRADWLRRDGFHASTSFPTPDAVTTPGFVDWLAERLTPFAPIHQWLGAAT